MPIKKLTLNDLGEVAIYKRKNARGIKLSVTHEGGIRLSIPRWLSYDHGVSFIEKNKDWILQKKPQKKLYYQNSKIGKTYILQFKEGKSISSKIVGKLIYIYLPPEKYIEDEDVQVEAGKVVIKALRYDAENILPQRVKYLADKNNIQYRSVKIRHLKSRWGSCNSEKDIKLSYFLIQLPWELIDYVILHELNHTRVLAHDKKFWDAFSQILENPKSYRIKMNNYQPVAGPTPQYID